MGDSSLTLLEIHLGDGDVEIGPFDLFGAAGEPGGIESEPAATENDDIEDDGDVADAEPDRGYPAGSAAGLLMALVALAAVAIAVAKLRGDDEVSPGIAGDD